MSTVSLITTVHLERWCTVSVVTMQTFQEESMTNLPTEELTHHHLWS